MNTINKRTGELLHNNKKSYLTKYELAMVNSLSDNKLKTYVELYREIYNVDVHELDPSEVHQITNIVSRLRRKRNQDTHKKIVWSSNERCYLY